MTSVKSGSVAVATAVPNCREGRCHPMGAVDFEWMPRIAVEAETLGFDSTWLNEFMTTEKGVAARYGRTPDYFEPLTSIGFMAALTKKIRFVTATLVLPFHHPLILGRQVATLDAMTGGRVTLGVGLGGSLEQFKALRGELTRVNRSQIVEESLASLRTLWTESPATFSSQYFSFDSVELWPKPIQSPMPVWIAGDADSIPARVAVYGDGWIDSHLSPEEVRSFRERIRSECHSVGRTGDDIAMARQFYISIGNTRKAAEANVADSWPGRNDPGSIGRGSDYTVVGTPAEVRAVLRTYANAGASELCAIFVAPDLERYVEQMSLFAEGVVPGLRA